MKAGGVIVLAWPAILRAQDGVAEKQESRIEINDVVRSRPRKHRPTTLPAEFALNRCFIPRP